MNEEWFDLDAWVASGFEAQVVKADQGDLPEVQSMETLLRYRYGWKMRDMLRQAISEGEIAPYPSALIDERG